MRASISLGRWFGIPVGLHYSWFVIAWLITLSLTSQFASVNRAWSPAAVWGLAAITAALFFVCIVLHQLMRMATVCFAVKQNGHVVGLITPGDVKTVAREQWDRTPVSAAMQSLRSLHPVRPDASAGDALELMGRENINQLPVISDGHLEGVVTRSYLVHLWHVRRELMA